MINKIWYRGRYTSGLARKIAESYALVSGFSISFVCSLRVRAGGHELSPLMLIPGQALDQLLPQ